MAFVHLQTHSHFSLLRATCRTKALLKEAIRQNAPAIALTDHGNMFGIMEFYTTAASINKDRIKEGLDPINPILGCHIYVDHPSANRKDETTYNRLTLLAENKDGYYNLLKIVSYCYDESSRWKEIPGIPLDFIKEKNKGLIALAGDYFSRFGHDVCTSKTKDADSFLNTLCEIFDKDHLYLTLQDQNLENQEKLNSYLIGYAKNHDRELVAVNNVHYISKDEYMAHKVLRCIGLAKKLNDFQKDPLHPTEYFYLRTEEEMRALFPEHPEAIENTVKIANRCKVHIWTVNDEKDMDGKSKFWPKYEFPKEFADSDAFLAHLCETRLKDRYKEVTEEVRNRLETELAVIKKMQVAGYLLIVWDFINWSRENGIPVGPGRGSAAGSIVTYIIGITDIDPLEFGLLFERFLNPERVSMPDIDTDISDRDRSRVIQYVTDHYGASCVCQIVTYGALKMRAVVNDVGRVLNIPLQEVKAINKLLPEELGATLSMAKTGEKKGKKLEGYSPEPLNNLIASRTAYKELWDYSEKLEDLVRQTGVHAAAVVIAPTEMSNLAPMFRANPADTPVVMYDKHYAEDIGLLKMDFLGLITLSLIQDALALIKKVHHIDLDISHIPLDDKKTYELFGKGLTIGVFQFESPGMQKYLRELQPDRIGDLIAMNALYRPGPIEQIPRFIRCKNGLEAIDCYHENLEPILKETYGVIVYQEQVMQIAQTLAGYSLGGADNIRRIMAKKMPEKMAKLEPEFFAKCEEHGYSKELVQKIWDVLLPFCNYAFNKSHAAAYAYVAYQTAYLKAHYGPEYMAATMSSDIAKTERLVILLQECEKLGINYLPPCVNRSFARFSVDENENILYGLAGIKNVGLEIVEDVVQEREANGPYQSLFDLCKRVSDYQTRTPGRHSPLSKKVLESLILAGALDNLKSGGSRAALFASVEKALKITAKYKEEKESGQVSLFDLGGDTETIHTPEVLEEVEDWSYMELLNKEKDVIGMYLSGHPLEEFRPELIGFASCTLGAEELETRVNSVVRLAGVVISMRSIETKQGKTIGIGTIQDFHGQLTLFFGAREWDKYRNKISVDDRVLITGKLDKQKDPRPGEEFKLAVDSFESLEEIRFRSVNFIHLSLNASHLTTERLEMLKNKMQELEPFPGEHGAKVIFHVETNDTFEHALITNKMQVVYNSEFLNWLKKEMLISKIWVTET